MRRAITWGLPLLTALVYLWMVLGHGLRLEAMTGGMTPFDLRVAGYDLAAARLYLSALPPEGVALYLGPIRVLDTVFPVLMTLCLLWWIAPVSGLWGGLAALPALAYGAADLAENAAVAVLLRAGEAGITPAQVALASLLTQAKFAFFVVAAVLVIIRVVQRRRV